MKIHLLIPSVLLLASSLPLTIHAEDITWGPVSTISGDTDVSLNGQSVWAYSFGAPGPFNVNGQTFIGEDTPSGNADVTLSLNRIDEDAMVGIGDPFDTLSEGYQSILAGVAFRTSNDPGYTIELERLVVGHQYEIQLWLNDSRNRSDHQSRTTTIAGTSKTLIHNTAGNYIDGGIGQYLVGTFDADSTSLSIKLTAKSSQLNAAQLRDIPEPGVTALLAGCTVLALSWLRQRK